MSNYGRETISIVQIDQPRCSRVYGDGLGSPSVPGGCQAALGSSGTRKCFNTRGTCQDPARYDPETLTLSFTRSQQGLTRHYGYIIPTVLDIAVAPGSINLGGMLESVSALGERERVTVKMADCLHSDLLVDKYRLERAAPGTISRGYESDSWMAGLVAPDGYFFNADIPGESSFALREGPYGDNVIVNVCESKDTPSGDPGPDGGWTMNEYMQLNPFRSHLLTVWVKRLSTGLSTNGQFYWGLHTNSPTDVLTLAGASQTNPYMANGAIAAAMPSADKWYLAVGFVHENGYGTTDTGISGVYDPETGAKVLSGIEFKWPSDATGVLHRAYHYYNEQISGEIQQMWDPKIYECTVAEADGLIDRILRTKGYDPYKRGTFWGKWLARNPYHTGYALRVYEGFVGDALEDMRVRHYVIDRIDGPSNGEVAIIAKDVFSLIEAQKAVAPVASRGELAANMTGSPATFTVEPAGIGSEYAASGYVQIGEEVIAYTRVSDTFTVTGRAQFGTTQANHEDEDLVQQVLVYTAQRAQNIVHDLICRFTSLGSVGSPTESPYINKALWDLRAEQIIDQFTGRISKPTPVKDLIAELAVQAGFSVWPDVSTGMIEFVALRAGAVTPTVTDRDFIVNESISTKREIEKRLTQIWVYYGQVNPAGEIEDRQNYRSRLVTADLTLEDEEIYGTPQIKEIFSRWIPQFGRQAAERCGERLLAMFRDPPLRASFTLHASRDGELDLARYFGLQTADIQDDVGDEEVTAMAVTRIKRGENEIAIEAHSVAFAEETTSGVREIYIENDSNNLDLREIHDLIYAAPVGGSPGESVQFTVLENVTVGSATTGPAIRTGLWPAGVTLRLINNGTILGSGGAGGAGGGSSGLAGSAGASGNTALKAERALFVENNHQIFGGGGGGGGGGGSRSSLPMGVEDPDPAQIGYHGGGGGGGGVTFGVGGNPGNGTANDIAPGSDTNAVGGSNGTASAGGAGGAGAIYVGSVSVGGTGGTGGGYGLAGSAGTTPSYFHAIETGSGGAGGAAGNYIEGNAFVTWEATGDRRGGVA